MGPADAVCMMTLCQRKWASKSCSCELSLLPANAHAGCMYAGGLERPATPEPKPAPRATGEVAPWKLAGASPGTPASLRAIQDQEASGSQVWPSAVSAIAAGGWLPQAYAATEEA